MRELKEERELLHEIPEELPVIPINDGVIFPYMLVPLILSDRDLIKQVDNALDSDKIVGVFTQKDRDVERPKPPNLYSIGCAMLIQKMARFPDGHIRIIGQGLSRVKIKGYSRKTNPMRAKIEVLKETAGNSGKAKALVRNVQTAFMSIIDKSENYPDELKNIVMGIKDPGRLSDLLASNLSVEIDEKQKILETLNNYKRLEKIYSHIDNELEIAKIRDKIRKDMHKDMDREQREYFLRKQLRVIKKELGEDISIEQEQLRERIENESLPEQVAEAAKDQMSRLSMMSSNSSEYVVTRTYLDWILDLPWNKSTTDLLDINKAERVLDKGHYDLQRVKERILEFLSVRKLKDGVIGSILCFVGPPGVGKTSLGMSVAEALGRKFVRISLGGVKDEAEIRGHRRTYIGALPGRIIQGIKNAGSNNPVFMMDEIDKLGQDYKGDPTSALLEVLDPDENNMFEDHYLSLPFDLSKVLFITTSNVRETIPHALLDRMEVMEISGYITSEKLQIAKKFLIDKEMKKNGIPPGKLEISDKALISIIEHYTREAGVRNLERAIGTIMRKVARKLAEGKIGPYRVIPRNIKSYLGPREYPSLAKLSKPKYGVATGMAKSMAGGVILFVEALNMKGRGGLKLTGYLGDVMKESAEAAMSYVKANYSDELADRDFFEKNDIHMHIPAGAVPKDGPSAGVAMAVALSSVALQRKVKNNIAMTGEITLTGKVLPVGAIKDKVIAAHRSGIDTVILPATNRKDIESIPKRIRKGLKFKFVNRLVDAISFSLD
ncbi:MAG TPA: endopeptidase La [Candidatus Krumholzibacteriaceae bacterium]|nr:endopeptidase La [Candidatus Krumholzibacteriaceae bacterium]